MTRHKHMGESLVIAGLLSRELVQRALFLQKQRGGFFGQILVEEGWITEQELCQTLAEIFQVHWVGIDCLLISHEVLMLVPKAITITCNVLPLFVQNNTLYLAMDNPCDTSIIQFIECKTRMQIKPLLATRQQLREMIWKCYYCDEDESDEFI